MLIQNISLGFPFDFLEQFIQTQDETRYYSAVVQTEGEFGNCTKCKVTLTARDQTAYVTLHTDGFYSQGSKVMCHLSKWKEINESDEETPIPIRTRRLQTKPKGNALQNTNSRKKSRRRSRPKEETSNVGKNKQNVKKIKLDSSSTKGLTPKTARFAVSTNNTTVTGTISESDTGNKGKTHKQDLVKNLRPRVSKINWSAIEQDSGEESGDSYHPDNDDSEDEDETTNKTLFEKGKSTTVKVPSVENKQEIKYGPIMVVSGAQVLDQSKTVTPGSRSLKTILPKVDVVKPVVLPVLPSNKPTVRKLKRKKKILPRPKSANSTQDIYKPVNKIVTMIGRFDKGGQKIGTVINIAACFPLQECPGTLRVIEDDVQTDRLTLVSSENDTDMNMIEDLEPAQVSFYINISKGVESKPKVYPKEFRRVSVKPEASIPIVINVIKSTKLTSASKERKSLRQKLAKLQEITGPDLVDGDQDKLTGNQPQRNETSVKVTNRKQPLAPKISVLKEKLDNDATVGDVPETNSPGQSTSKQNISLSRKLASVRRKPGAITRSNVFEMGAAETSEKSRNKEQTEQKKKCSLSHKLDALKAKLNTDQTEDKDKDSDDEGSSDSEEEYADEKELVEIPQLSVEFPVLIDLCRSYAAVKEGSKIPLLDFVVSSTQLLKAAGERFYIQGKKEGVNGIVLLGPFSMEYNPKPYLNFLRVAQSLTRIPRHIYERRRQRWLRKHDKKPFIQAVGGFRSHSALAFADHDYLNTSIQNSQDSLSAKCHKDQVPQSGQRGTTLDKAPESEDIMIISTKGLDDDDVLSRDEEDLFTYSLELEDKIPVIGNLEDAWILKRNTGTADRNATSDTLSNIHETISFDDLPAVTMEAVLNSAGVQISSRVIRKEKNDPAKADKKTPVIENDESAHVPLKYTCKYCLKVRSNNFRLSSHVKAAHQNHLGFMDYAREVLQKEGIKCNHCSREKLFYSKDGLRAHINTHHIDKVIDKLSNIAKRTCPTCKKVFAQRRVLNTHIQRAHVEAQYLCDRCPGIFKSKQTLSYHIKGKHDNIRNFICEICGASYVCSFYLRKHIKNIHTNRTTPEGKSKRPGRGAPGKSRFGEVKNCFLCGYAFDSVNLKKHLKQIHGVESKDIKKCGECSLTFNDRAELEYHRYAAHDYEYDFNCPYCGGAYVKKNSMTEHILTFHYSLNLYECFVCGVNCNKAHQLTEHMLQQHKEVQAQDEDRKLTCNHCSEVFKTHKSLIEHLLLPAHEDVFKHNCLSCKQCFMHEHDLEHHIKIVHCQNRPAHFEIRCHSKTDRIVHLVVNKEVNDICDLPPKAQLVLKRLQKQGKQVMIVSKEKNVDVSAKPKETPIKTTSKSIAKKANKNSFDVPSSTPLQAPVVYSRESVPVSKSASLEDKPNIEGCVLCPPSSETQTDLRSYRSRPEVQALKVYRMAVQSEEVEKALGSIDQHKRHMEQVQTMSVEDQYVEAEQIGRLDESGNIIEDTVLYVDEEAVSEDLLMMLQSSSQSFIQ